MSDAKRNSGGIQPSGAIRPASPQSDGCVWHSSQRWGVRAKAELLDLDVHVWGGADVKNEKIAIGGWIETTDIWIYDFIEKYIRHGVRQLFCTDVSKDGKLEGPATELYKSITGKFPELHFIASGGVSSMQDLDALRHAGCKGVIIGKAIYEGRLRIGDLRFEI